jgi:hypothetical protein
MKIIWGFEGLPKGPAEAATLVGDGTGYNKKSFTGEAGESARGALLLFVSMILLLFNLLNGQRDSR